MPRFDSSPRRLVCPEDHPVVHSDIIVIPIRSRRAGPGLYAWYALVDVKAVGEGGTPGGDIRLRFGTATAVPVTAGDASPPAGPCLNIDTSVTYEPDQAGGVIFFGSDDLNVPLFEGTFRLSGDRNEYPSSGPPAGPS